MIGSREVIFRFQKGVRHNNLSKERMQISFFFFEESGSISFKGHGLAV